ncbi:hypothetical protein N7462_007994 [Penicillium macrosclerotiorum]|uniref:uncharacterized protein n=1 Tax=Penicillium macrosclerotiorum TaxID=303699 RepID=UPI002546FBA0|nr:uncharacterized protein N7462_007994 [Penicillium macrosclerotiorum]KAJ5679750.1 hypothetical protein N7462_007994 [Penicillium macrosclerotiorum]
MSNTTEKPSTYTPLRASDQHGQLPERSPQSGITVLIVGAGVAGLMAGLECWRKGHDVRIVEKSSSRLLSGDSFTIGTSAIRALQLWPDMAEKNEQISTNPWLSWHKITGERISGPAPIKLDPIKKTPGTNDGEIEAPTKLYRHSRPKFHKMLSDQIERIGLVIEYGKRVTGYFEKIDAQQAGVTLDDGSKIEADVVIAADGIGSKSSKLTMGDKAQTRPTGYSIYRAAFPAELATSDPLVQERFKVLEGGTPLVELWMAEDMHVMFSLNRLEMTWSLTYPDFGEGSETWSTFVDPEIVLRKTATVEGWPEVADRVIKLTPKDRLHDFRLMWRDPQPCWVSPGGLVIQIGDAAHTFLPSSGNGATQGIEDAVSVATCLQIAGRSHISQATRVHNTLRFERVACLQKLGVINQEMRHRSADAKISQAKPVGLLGAWIWRHDPERYAIDTYSRALDHLLCGSPFQNTNIPSGLVYKPWTVDELLKTREAGEEIDLDGDWE